MCWILCSIAVRHEIFFLWRPVLRDPRDDMVLELAVAAGCESIVSYNRRDFKAAERFGIQVESSFLNGSERLRDPRDDMVLELAVAAGCESIVSYNRRDFKAAERFGIQVESAGEFLERIGEMR
jgi:predicted nucleic acid-binding protein